MLRPAPSEEGPDALLRMPPPHVWLRKVPRNLYLLPWCFHPTAVSLSEVMNCKHIVYRGIVIYFKQAKT